MLPTFAVFDIDGVVRDVSASYRRALADTVEAYTQQAFRPSHAEVDHLKAEGVWNNDWEASQELIYRYFESQGQSREQIKLDYTELVAFFQQRYRGSNWDGYILNEPLLMSAHYLHSLTQAGIGWGFFSGATRGSASFVLEKRLGLSQPVLIAMEDAPGKPDPPGLFATVAQLTKANQPSQPPKHRIFYIGDTVADMQTVIRAKALHPAQDWIGIGVLPPHVSDRSIYQAQLEQAGARKVFSNVEAFTPEVIASWVE
jgi:HAD superfamily phosphatase